MNIEIDKLKKEDVGRLVKYKTNVSNELGYITSYNSQYVFVNYRDGGPSKATDPNLLQFVINGGRRAGGHSE